MTTPVPSLDALFEVQGTVIAPGLLRALGITTSRWPVAEPDESYEAFLDRISKEPAT